MEPGRGRCGPRRHPRPSKPKFFEPDSKMSPLVQRRICRPVGLPPGVGGCFDELWLMYPWSPLRGRVAVARAPGSSTWPGSSTAGRRRTCWCRPTGDYHQRWKSQGVMNRFRSVLRGPATTGGCLRRPSVLGQQSRPVEEVDGTDDHPDGQQRGDDLLLDGAVGGKAPTLTDALFVEGPEDRHPHLGDHVTEKCRMMPKATASPSQL